VTFQIRTSSWLMLAANHEQQRHIADEQHIPLKTLPKKDNKNV
jgi:hypothetical protein